MLPTNDTTPKSWRDKRLYERIESAFRRFVELPKLHQGKPMKKLFNKFMILLAIALTHNCLFRWLRGYDDSLLSFICDSDISQPETLDVKTLWWCKARRAAQ